MAGMFVSLGFEGAKTSKNCKINDFGKVVFMKNSRY
jgi:hypothetical protein